MVSVNCRWLISSMEIFISFYMGDNLYHPCLMLFKHLLSFLGNVAVQYFFNFIFLLFYSFSYILLLKYFSETFSPGYMYVCLFIGFPHYVHQTHKVRDHYCAISCIFNFLVLGYYIIYKFYF